MAFLCTTEDMWNHEMVLRLSFSYTSKNHFVHVRACVNVCVCVCVCI
jgi:hypothetical protein